MFLSSDFHIHAVVCMQATTTQTHKYFCLFSLEVGGRRKENYKETRLPVKYSYHNKIKNKIKYIWFGQMGWFEQVSVFGNLKNKVT